MGTINVHAARDYNVTDAGDQNFDGIRVQKLRFYVEQLGNEEGVSIIGTSDQGNGRAINLVISIQVFAFKVSHSQNSIAPTPFHLAYLLSLPNLLARRIRRTKLLDDYNKSHVVTIIEYLKIMRQKATQKEPLEHIIDAKRNEKEERKDMRVIELLNVTEQLVEK